MAERRDRQVRLDSSACALRGGTALVCISIALAAAPSRDAQAACAGENTGNVQCDAANPATAGTLTTVFPGSTVVNVNPGGAITTGGASVASSGGLTFNHNDTTFGISGGISLSDSFGPITYTGDAPVIGTIQSINTVAGGNVAITQNAALSGVFRGIMVTTTSGSVLVTGSGDITVTGPLNPTIRPAIDVRALGGGDITVTGSGNVSHPFAAGIQAVAFNGNVLVARTGTVSGTVFGILASAEGSGSVTVNVSNNVTAIVGPGVATVAAGGASAINVTAGTVQGLGGGISATSTSGNILVNLAAGTNVTGTSGVGVGISAGSGTTVTNAGAISGTTGVQILGGATTTATVVNSGSVTGTGGTAVRLVGGANNLFVMDGPNASLVGAAIGSSTDTFRLAGDGANSFNVSQIGTGWSAFEKAGSSTWTLTGTATYAGPTAVNAGTLLVNGSLASSSGVTVASGATLGGTGTVGSTVVNGGGTLSPGNSIGVLTINGNLVLGAGSIYRVEVSPSAADRTNVTGSATLAGTAQLVFGPGAYTSNSYTILSAVGGRTGTFDTVTTSGLPPTLSASLNYTATDVLLVTLISQIAPSLAGITPNQKAVAAAQDAAFNRGLPSITALFGLSLSQLPAALDQLSGEVHASTAGVLVDESLYPRSAVLSRLRQASYDGDSRMAALAFGGPQTAFADGDELAALAYAKSPLPVKAPPKAPQADRDIVFWAQGFGARGRFDGDGNAASVRRDLAGFITGLDTRVGASGRAGIAAGYTGSRNALSGRGSADVETAHVAAYGGWSFGALNLRAGGAYGRHSVATDRAIAFPGFFDRALANYDGGTGQVFGEIGYGFALGRVAVEPFAGGAWVRLDTDAAVERGGAAALNVAANRFELGYSTLGIRAAGLVPLGDNMMLIPRASAAWQHAFGDVAPAATLAFQTAPALPFAIAGVPIARDALLAEAGLDLAIGRNATLGLSYIGQVARNVSDHGAKGKFSWKF